MKPKPIRGLKGLTEIPVYARTSGVYFLCLGDEVVYIGQSQNPAGRITEHAANGRMHFNRVYVLSVPADDLNNVEGAFIRLLKPTQQIGPSSSKASVPRMTRPALEVLEDYAPRSWLPYAKNALEREGGCS